MTPAPAARRRLFLVERYLPVSDLDFLRASVAGVAATCGHPNTPWPHVRYVHATYLPADDTCFCVFEAPSEDDVVAVNVAAEFVVCRVSEGFDVHPGPSIGPRQ